MRAEKRQLVQDIRDLLAPASCFFLVTYKGLTVADIAELRRLLEDADAECHVVPNRLLRLALEAESGLDGFPDDVFVGDTAVVTGRSEGIPVAKALRSFAGRRPAVSFKIGALAGRLCTAAEAASLADMPSIDVMRARLVGLLQAPATQLAGVLQAKVASVLYALRAYVDKQEQSA